MATNNEDIKWLYGRLKDQGYDIGTEQEFTSSLANEADRQWYYEKATDMGLNMGSMADFNSLYAPQTAQSAAAPTAQSAAAPAATALDPQPSDSYMSFKMRRGGKDIPVSVAEAKAAGGIQAWAAQRPGAPWRVYMQGGSFDGHVPLSEAHNRWKQKGYKYKLVDTRKKTASAKPDSAKPDRKLSPAEQAQQMWEIEQQIAEGNKNLSNIREQTVDRMQNVRKVATRPLGESELVVNPKTGKRERTYFTEQGNQTDSKLAQSYENTAYNELWENTTDQGNKSRNERLNRELEEMLIGVGNSGYYDKAALAAWDAAEKRLKADRERIADEIYSSKGDAMADAVLLGGPQSHIMNAAENNNRSMGARLTHFDLDRMMADAWDRLDPGVKNKIVNSIERKLSPFYAEEKCEERHAEALKLARQQSDLRVYQLAVDKNAPKDALDYLMRKIGDMNLLTNLNRGMAVMNAGGKTGDMAAREAANEIYRQDGHKTLDVVGMVAGFALDPTSWVSGGVGSAATKSAMRVGGWLAGRGASAAVTKAATRQFTTSMTGRIVGGVAGGAASFGTFEGVKEMENQFAHGGHIVGQDETGRYVNEGYSADAVKNQFGHGLMMGGAVGWLGPVSGNVSDKLVRATSSTVGKVATRAGVYTGATLAEGTIFSVPEWIEGKRDAMDVWTENMAMVAGFKAKHMLKSAGGVLGDLKASFDRPANGRKNRLDFESRLRQRMDAPSDGGLALTKDEKAELQRYGYDLRDLVENSARTGDAAEGSLIARNAPEIVSRLTDMVRDPRISEAARAKMYYFATGRKLPMSTVMRGELIEDGDGGFIVESQGANGVITSRSFKSRKAANLELERIKRQVELNTIEIGERYQQTADFENRLQEACRTVAEENGWDMVEVYRTCAEARRNHLRGGDKQFDEVQQNILRKVTDAMGEFEETGVTDEIRGRINEKHGVDIDGAIRKEANRRTPQEQTAIDEYIAELIPEKAKEGNPVEDVKADDITNQKPPADNEATEAAEPASEQAEAQRRYEQGRELFGRFEEGDTTVQADVDAIVLRVQEAKQAVEEAFGEEAEYWMWHINEHPWTMVDEPELTVEQKDAVLYYINAKAALDGVMDASNEVADRKRVEIEESVAKRTHKDNGVIIPATMKVGDRPVYIVKGDVAMFPDGTAVDVRNSSESVVVMDAQTGEYHFTSPDRISKVSKAVNPQDELDAALSVIEQEQMNIFGDNAVVPEGVTDVEEYNKGFEDGASISMPDEELNSTISRLSEDSDVSSFTDYGRGWLDGLKQEQQRRIQAAQAESVPTSAGTTKNPTRNAVSPAESAPNSAAPVENERQPEYDENGFIIPNPADVPIIDNSVPARPKQEQTPLERIARDAKGEPMFEQAENPEHGWDALVEFAEGDAATAKEIADAMAEEKRKAYEKAQRQKPKGKTPTEMLASKKAITAELAKAEQEYNMWQQMANVEQRRQNALRAEQKAEARQRAAERAEAEKAEREARERAEAQKRKELGDIPEWHMDTPENARKRGARRYNGTKFERQQPLNGENSEAKIAAGKEVEVKFSRNDIPKGRMVVMEADSLQPSHLQGERNPLFFIDEAQPKDRTDGVSAEAAQKIAAGIRPEEITDAALAHTGAPVVNARGEVIQGNNRSDALRYLWGEDGLARQQHAYKQYLIDNAERFGLNPQEIEKMERPVLVRMIDVDDSESIRLGQIPMGDNESGGVERIKAANVAGKLGDDMRSFANILLRSTDDDASLGQLVDNNGVEALKWLNKKGAITNTEYQSAFDSKGNITAEGKNDLLKVLYRAVFKGGSKQLEEMFQTLPAKAQRAVLTTAFRDMESPEAGRMLPEIQASVIAYHELSNSETFARAKKLEEVLQAVEDWKRQSVLDDRMEIYYPADNFSNFALHLAAMYKASDMTQTSLTGHFNRMFDLAQGKVSGDLFEEPDSTKYSLAEIVRKVLGIEYQPAKNSNRNDRVRSNALVIGNQHGPGGKSGNDKLPEGRKHNPSGAGTSDRGAGTSDDSRGVGERRNLQPSEKRTKGEASEIDENGLPFVVSENGTTSFGVIREESGLPSAPIKLSEGYQDENGKGYGLRHIEAGHGDEIRNAGFPTVEEFVSYVAKNYDEDNIKVGKQRHNGNTTYLIQATDSHDNTLFIELSHDGSYWNVNSGGVFRKGYSNKKETVAKTEPQQPNNAVSSDSSLSTDEQSGTSSIEPNGKSTVSDRKVNNSVSEKQGSGKESSEPYTITPTTYTNKKGKTSDVYLVKFNRELTAEEKAALDTFAREPLTEGKKTSRGWYGREQGGYMMRSEEAARQLAEMIGNEEAVADAQPMTAEELRAAVGASRTRDTTRKPAKPKKAPINRVSLEDVMADLSTKGETKLSDHAEPDKAEPEQQYEISDDEMQSLADELRDLLGIGDDEGDKNIKFRDPGELTPQERQRIQSAGIRLAMGLIERGTTVFPDYASKMVGLLGDKIRPWLKSFYEGARWTPGYEKYTFTPTEQVATFDVQNFDKKHGDPIAQAAMIVEERKAGNASAQAQKELTETRNKNRRENDKQTETDTAALAGKAKAVAGQADATAKSAGTGRKHILRDLKRVDDTLDEVNDRLALLGYYEADLDAPEHEVYGLRRSAEKKAVKDAVKLAQRLVDDLGLGLDKVTGSTTDKRGKKSTAVSANVTPVGGDIVINLPYTDGRNLYINIGLTPTHERGVDPKRGGGAWEGDNYEVDRIMFRFGDGHNHFLPTDVTYGKMLAEIQNASRWGQREAKDYLPSTSAKAENPHNLNSATAVSSHTSRNWQAEPTEAQKAAGNYKMEHRRVDGYNISIENAKGSVRRGTGADGKPWETVMQNDYGYIRGTEGVDGDHIDVFLSDTPEEGDVFVVDQVNEDGSFDEHKVMYGFPTEQAARDAYLSNYEPGWTGLGAITHVSKDEFKKWIQSSRRKTKPFAEYKSVKPLRYDSQGNPIDENRNLIIEDVKSVADITDADFTEPTRTVGLPTLPEIVQRVLSTNGKKVIIKKNIFERNALRHDELTPEVSRAILNEALYNPTLYGKNKPLSRPNNWIVINVPDGKGNNKLVVLEVNENKDNVEIVHWHEVDNRGLEKIKRQAEREDGQLLILPSETSEEAGALSSPTLDSPKEKLSPSSERHLTEAPNESEGPDLVPTSDNVMSSDRKVNTSSADKQEENAGSSLQSKEDTWKRMVEMAERGKSPYTVTEEVEQELAGQRKAQSEYKPGDEVEYSADGKTWKKAKVVEIDNDGVPVLDTGMAPMLYVRGNEGQIRRPKETIFEEAARVAKEAREKKRVASKRKTAGVKPEQTIGDLFGGREHGKKIADKNWVLTAYDNSGADNTSAISKVDSTQAAPIGTPKTKGKVNDKSSNIKENEKTDVQSRPGTAERERGHKPQSHEPLGASQRNEVKGTDGRGMGGRGSVNPMSDKGRGSGVSRQPKSQSVLERLPESERKNVRNNHAERGVDYAPKGEDARIKANMEAIELAKRLLDAGETATPEQMAVLRKFSGWGGLGKAFNEQGYTPNPIAKRLKELLGENGYQDAVDSRRSAYYTPAEVIDTMWDIARAMGFKGGNVLEGSAGIGNIIGLMPADMSERSSIHAVEIDSTTGGILSLLYPDAKVEIQGFEKTRVQNGTVDLAITNVPFITGAKVFDETGDKDLSKKFHDIHDFCIAKNIRKLREGGIGIFITSSGTMDNSKGLRLWIIGEGNADVVGAFRMHNKTFGGTGATSDIIVVRKRVNGKPSPNAIDVTDAIGVRVADYDTGDIRKVKGREIPIIKQYSMMYNKYFAEHPENMAGEMMFNFERGETRFPTSRGLFPVKEKEQSKMLAEWAGSFADMEEEATAVTKVEDEITRINEQLGEGVKEGSMVLNSQGELCMARMGVAVPLGLNKNRVKGHTKAECFKAYSAIKKALSDVLEYQSSHEGDEGLAPLLKELNHAFDTFTRTYGNLHKNTAISFLRNDVDFSSILALETYSEKGDKKGNKVVEVGKTDIFSRRVIDTEKEPQPATIKDGILASLYKNGGVDVEYIGRALGKPTEEVKREIVSSGLGFENPSTGTMEVSYKYLSGNVREKLHIAQENNTDGRYDANIKALEGVMPMTIPAHLIEFSLGSSWIEPKLYEDFVYEKTGLRVTLTNAGGTWFMKTPWSTFNEKNRSMAVVSKMCGKTIMGHELIEAAITNRQITVSKTKKRYDGSTETMTDRAATAECGVKVDEIRAEFKDWARERMQADPAMSARVEQTYNDRFNNYVPMSIPDEFVPRHFGGQVSELHGQSFALRPHQGRAAVRATTEPILLAHEVGTGKTYTLITTAMEMRRLGTARKPMIVVQNATVGQFVESAKEIYPNAKVLTIEEADRTAEGRKNFYAKIKYNDWDMIVVPQSVFERIPDSEEREMAYVEDIIEEKMKVLEAMREADSDGRSMIVRQAERELAEQQARLAELTETMQGKKKKRDEKREATIRQNAEVRALEMLDREVDDVENFDDMGIDAILVDEAHEYKHLGFATAMQRGVKGIDPSYSKKSQGVFLKSQAVMERNNGRNVVFATGTPISNTAAEIWTFMRYLMPVDTMKSYGIYYFDDFVRNFGNIAQMVEFSTSGKFKENNRFAGYVNLPELVRIWSSVADTVLTREAGGVSDKIPDMEGGKPQDIYLPQTRALRSVMKYVKAELDRYDKMSGKEKKENSHIPLTMYGIAKAAAVDVRLVVPNAEDDPNSKTNATVRETLRSLRDSEKYKGTVAVFSDNYQNKQSGFNLYEDIRKKLIAEGVPAEQIVVIKPGMTVKRKLDIFEKVNTGEIRVIMGSTFTLGTGVNIQERLHTLIHVDAPNRPMDYTQRNGRALRQGNLHKDMGIPIRIIRFGVEDSLDVTAYQRLKTKGAIADSIMNGSKMMQNSMENRVLEEEEDSFGDMTAQLSGSEYAILKNQAEREVRNLTAKQKGHDIDQIYVHNQLPKVEGFIKGAERRIEIETKNLEIIGSHFPAGTIKKITIGKLTFGSVAAMEDFFKEQNAKMNEAAENIREGADNYTSKLAIDVDGLKFEVTTTVSRTIDSKGQSTLTFEPERNVTYSCEELGIKDQAIKGNRLKNVIQKIAEDIVTGRESRELLSRGQQQLAHYTEERTQLEQRNGREFPYKQELAEAKERLAKYEEAMKKELAEKEAKYAELDKSVETASDITLPDEDSTDTPTTEAGNKYRLVAERELLDFLDRQPLKKGYRYSQWANMGVLPPMTAKQNGEWRAPMIFSRWEQSEEGMRKENGKADLVQGNGRTTGDVAYNPYFHIRTSPLNDQFTAAYDRPELLVVEGYYPESEETSGYQAEGANDSVGLMNWHSGSVNGQLSEDTKVQTMLSRYFKPSRIVPWSEVADLIMERVGNQKITFPINAVPPMLRAELAKRGAKFGDISGNVAEADIPMLNELRDRVNAGEWDAGLEKARAYLDAYESSTEAKEARVADLSEKTHTPIRIIRTREEVDALPTRRQRRAKGWWSAKNDEVVIVLPNNVNVADVDNTFVHEVVGHKGLRALIGEERFDEFLGEVYDHASNPIRKVIDKKTGDMVNAEADRLRVRKAQARERAGEDVNSNYYADMATARVEAEAKREEFRREATEEYMSDLGGRIGSEGFEKMSRDEQTLWGKIKAKVQAFLDKFLQGLKIAKSIRLNDKDLSYILYKSWKNLRKKSVFAEAEDAVMRRRTGWDDAMLSESAKVEDANNRFNRELQQQIDGTLPDGHIYQLGNPGTILRSTGVPNLPIQMSATRLRVKATEYGHDFDLAEIRNLVKELQTPMAVFAYGDKGKMQNIIVGIESNGKQYIVGLSLNPIVNGRALEINSVRNVFPKNNAEWLNWISQGKLLYADKQKIQALIDKQRTILADVAYLDLEDVAKIIKDFENPTFEGDEDVKFRDGADYVERVPVMARAMYEKRIQSSMYQFTEAMQDSMRGLMEFYKAVESQGAKRNIEDVSSFENAYIAENLMSSKSHAEMDEYEHRIMRPLLDIAARMSVNKRGRKELTDYMMAKHGLERNAYMRNEATANGEESERDFAGLCGLTGKDVWMDAEAAAQQIVDDYEAAHSADIAGLWSAVNKATKASLKKVYDCGLLSKEQYEKIRDMYDYYIPLRGFDEKTSGDVYGYLTSKEGAFSSPIKKAEGRKSKADDPLATIAYMAQNSIIQGNRNVMKQKFLTYVQNHPSDLVSVNRLWLVYDDIEDIWKPVFADIDESMTPDEIDKEINDFEERMKSLSQSEPDKYKRGRDAIGIPYRIVDGKIKEHQVVVKRNGESFVITINGNPRAAQAVNGLTNPDNDLNGAIGKVFNMAGVVNRQLSQFYTTRNPDFVVSNFIRDLIYSNTMVHVKESQGYAMKFHKNHAKVNPICMVRLLRLYEGNKLNMRNPIHRMFYEFMHWGGETGYTMQRNLEREKKHVAKIIKEARRGYINPVSLLNLIGNSLDRVNRGVENSARFAAYITSREIGRDVQRSIYDAKEISVNFNKKGAGSKFMDAKGQTIVGKTAGFTSGLGRSFYVFWNAAVQGTANYGKAFKKHPVRAITSATALVLLGYIMAALMDDHEDEDKNGYYNIPKYTRRSNLMFRADKQWITIPLPIEYRALYGLGELSYSVTSGREEYSDAELAKEMSSQLSQLLPLDFMEGGGGLHAFVPSAAKPIVESATNTTWTGLPIYKDTPFNKDVPEWTKAYPRTNSQLIDLSKWVNEASGGNDYKAGWANINPAQLEYLLNGYFGGYSNVVNKMLKTGETMLGERDYDPSNILLVNRLVKMGDERTEEKKIKSDFFKYHEEYKRTHSLLRKYEDEANRGSDKYRIFLDALKHSRDGARHDIMEEYIADYNWLNRAIKDPEITEEDRAAYEDEMRKLKREVVSLMKVAPDSLQMNRLREQFAREHMQQ